MIFKESFLNVVDNSGGLLSKCIHIYKKKIGIVGDLILVSIIRIKKRKLVHLNAQTRFINTRLLYKAIIIQTKTRIYRLDGHSLLFYQNNIVLLSRIKENLLGSRIFRPMLREFRKLKKYKLLLISSYSV